jgi:alpha-amylase/alpha-mannosidase (GH57 family)
MEKYICIHGHFYQPPRENPWLESIEVQDSASPYHDWNERICVECYAPNATARIVNGDRKIQQITNNYSKISFNFGPTLLTWMKDKMPEIHQAIVDADTMSQKNFSGHGSAMAQVYNHMILPLANTRDKYTQVLWGIRDFQHRFGRMPEGMWLAETGADTETLDTLAQLGVKFTVLSPFQASKTREMGKRNWKDVNGAQIDPSRSYRMKLPGNRSINLFFYDAPVSQAVAFEKLLTSGERFANRLMGAIDEGRQWDQLVHIATDGESYGHHHKHGEMALAYALQYIEEKKVAKLTNYGEFLEKYPPTNEVQIHEKSAWSCSHGVGRWMADCGCNSGGNGGWNQAWRAPLRNALDWLRDELAPMYEQQISEFVKDPWGARNEYISVILNRHEDSRNKFFSEQAKRELNGEERVIVLKLLELQRHALLMYTSCGWFFDELSGIETVQVVQYAARVMQLAREIFGKDFEPGFLERLQQARSNIPEHGDGRNIYEKFVKPAMIDWQKTAAHYAISTLFQEYGEKSRIFSFTVEDEDKHIFSAGKTRLAIGRARIISEITQESEVLSYAILYMGEHNLTGGVGKFPSQEAYDAMVKELKAAYDTADFPETMRALDRHFGQASYSLKSLFKDEQRRILAEILESTREDLENRFRLISERYTPLLKFLRGSNLPMPPALSSSTQYVLHSDIRRAVLAEPLDIDRLKGLIGEAQTSGGRVLDDEIAFAIKTRMEGLMQGLMKEPGNMEIMGKLEKLAELTVPLPLHLNLWKVQNDYWEMINKVLPEYRNSAEAGDEVAQNWIGHFLAVGERLWFAVEHLRPASPMQAAA